MIQSFEIETLGVNRVKDEVLIVGAGPSGLAMAIALSSQGTPFKIIDDNKGPGTASRAMVVQSRVIEFYRQLGFDDKIVNAGIPIESFNVYKDRNRVAYLPVAKKGKGVSPYPFALTLPQDVHEEILVEELEERNEVISWEHELIHFENHHDYVSANIRQPNGDITTEEFAYICGCDGASSIVRKTLDLRFPGGTYQQMFYVADVTTNAHLKGASMGFHENDFCVGFPIRTTGQMRLIGLIPDSEKVDGEPPKDFEPIIPYAEQILPIKITHVNWYSSYHAHHRVAESFKIGRAFICGDAGHIHSPAGGQGMNTGISDAINLAWKMSAVLQDKASANILNTYEPERIAFAKALVNTTDKGFKLMTNYRFVKDIVIPHIAPVLLSFDTLKRKFYKIISQTAINYRQSELSNGYYGNIHGGDRLPWIHTNYIDNFEPLKTPVWQLHIYGEINEEVKELAYHTQIPIYHQPWVSAMKSNGIEENTVVLVRPDGYISVATNNDDLTPIQQMIEHFNIKPS